MTLIRIGGAPIGGAGQDGALPGPMTLRLIHAFIDRVGVDFVAQAMSHLGDNATGGLAEKWEGRLEAVG